jgi:NCS1 family nucleobase:cation symporter-1
MLYWILAKSVDVEAETKVAKTEAEELERLARAHRRPEGRVDNVTG